VFRESCDENLFVWRSLARGGHGSAWNAVFTADHQQIFNYKGRGFGKERRKVEEHWSLKFFLLSNLRVFQWAERPHVRV
jgi:hypothetical protein